MWLTLLIVLVIIVYHRSLPLYYHGSIYIRELWRRYINGKKVLLKDILNHESVISLRAWPDDLDFNLHLNNACYNKNADYARVHFLLETGLYNHCKKRGWNLANGGVAFQFRREIKPFQSYSISVRITEFDNKWFSYAMTFKVKQEVMALGYCRFVVKEGRKTVPPTELFASLGLQEKDYQHLKKDVLSGFNYEVPSA